MTKTNKKSIVALVVMAFLLVASIVLGATGAWFTSVDSDNTGELTFGNITIDLTATAGGVSHKRTTGDVATADLMPGDTIDIEFNIKNAANSDESFALAYVKAVVYNADGTVYNGEADVSALEAQLTGWIDAESTELEADTGIAKAFSINDSTTGVDVAVAEILAGETYGDEYEDLVVKFTITVFAIQQANLTDAQAATYIIANADLDAGTIDANVALAA